MTLPHICITWNDLLATMLCHAYIQFPMCSWQHVAQGYILFDKHLLFLSVLLLLCECLWWFYYLIILSTYHEIKTLIKELVFYLSLFCTNACTCKVWLFFINVNLSVKCVPMVKFQISMKFCFTYYQWIVLNLYLVICTFLGKLFLKYENN